MAIQIAGRTATISIFPKQRQFIESKLDDVFFGGSVGPGKTYALLLLKLKRRMEHKNSHGILLRRSFPDLERSLIMESKKMYPLFGARYNDSKHVWTFPNGAVERFAHLDKDDSVYDHRSAEYHDVGIDEASLCSEFQIRYMTSRLRSSQADIKPILRLASNPGGISHGFLRRRYVTPYERNKVWTDPETGKTMSFIPAKITDNPALMKNDPGYVKRLQELPEKQRMMLLDGRWDVYEGQFWSEFSPDRHVLKEVRNPDSYTMKFLGIDWGYAEPACVLWFEVTPLGRVFIYRELYVTGRSPKELAHDILELSPKSEKYMYAMLSTEVFGKKVELEGGGEPIAKLMQDGLGTRVVLQRANNARVAGWTKIREYLGIAPDEYPWLQISPNCKNLIRVMPDMIHAEKKPEDMEEGEDHACLVGETTVETKGGIKTLQELVGTEGEIWMQVGWRRYTGVQVTGKNVDVFKLKLKNGNEIVGTKDHKFMTSDGWVEMKNLDKDHLVLIQSGICKLKLFLQRFKSLTENVTTPVGRIFKGTVSDFIVWYGNFIMERLQKGFIFIIRIIIEPITSQTIWKNLLNFSTYPTMPLQKNIKDDLEKRWIRFDTLQQSGIKILKTTKHMLGLESWDGKLLRSVDPRLKFVGFVKKSMRRFVQRGHGFVISIVKCLGIEYITQRLERTLKPMTIESVQYVGKKDVYNLSVEEVHSYFANGSFLVKNCDALRYGLISMKSIPKTIMSPYRSTYHKIFGTEEEKVSNVSQIPGKYGRYGK